KRHLVSLVIQNRRRKNGARDKTRLDIAVPRRRSKKNDQSRRHFGERLGADQNHVITAIGLIELPRSLEQFKELLNRLSLSDRRDDPNHAEQGTAWRSLRRRRQKLGHA